MNTITTDSELEIGYSLALYTTRAVWERYRAYETQAAAAPDIELLDFDDWLDEQIDNIDLDDVEDEGIELHPAHGIFGAVIMFLSIVGVWELLKWIVVSIVN